MLNLLCVNELVVGCPRNVFCGLSSVFDSD